MVERIKSSEKDKAKCTSNENDWHWIIIYKRWKNQGIFFFLSINLRSCVRQVFTFWPSPSMQWVWCSRYLECAVLAALTSNVDWIYFSKNRKTYAELRRILLTTQRKKKNNNNTAAVLLRWWRLEHRLISIRQVVYVLCLYVVHSPFISSYFVLCIEAEEVLLTLCHRQHISLFIHL